MVSETEDHAKARTRAHTMSRAIRLAGLAPGDRHLIAHTAPLRTTSSKPRQSTEPSATLPWSAGALGGHPGFAGLMPLRPGLLGINAGTCAAAGCRPGVTRRSVRILAVRHLRYGEHSHHRMIRPNGARSDEGFDRPTLGSLVSNNGSA
jgi:hypothetical protein